MFVLSGALLGHLFSSIFFSFISLSCLFIYSLHSFNTTFIFVVLISVSHWQAFSQDCWFWREDPDLIFFHIVGAPVMRSQHVDFLCSEFIIDSAG